MQDQQPAAGTPLLHSDLSNIPLDLSAQVIQGIELLLPAHKAEKLHFDIHPVEVAVEFEEMNFEHALAVVRNCGTDAEVGDALEILFPDAD